MSEARKKLVEVTKLRKYFPVRAGFLKTNYVQAVQDVSLFIYEGETLGLVGESGCGKTTFVRTLLQLYQPTSGKIVYDGKVIYDVKPGTQSDTRIRLKNKGVPTIRNSAIRGDHYVTLVVETPTKLSKEAKELLKQFDALTGDSLNEAERVTKDNTTNKKEQPKKKKFWKS